MSEQLRSVSGSGGTDRPPEWMDGESCSGPKSCHDSGQHSLRFKLGPNETLAAVTPSDYQFGTLIPNDLIPNDLIPVHNHSSTQPIC